MGARGTMRFKDVISVSPHLGLNNNQLQRSSLDPDKSEEVENQNETSSNIINQEENDGFRIAKDTTRWSSIATNIDTNLDSSTHNNINNNLTIPRLYQSSSAESLADYEGSEDPSHESTPSDWSDWSEEGNLPPGCRGIVNPNYPGFHHLGPSLLSDTDSHLTEDEQDSCAFSTLNDKHSSIEGGNEFNNNVQPLTFENINQLDGLNIEQKIFYDKPKFNIHTVNSLYESVVPPSEKCINYVKSVEVSRNEEAVLAPDPEALVNTVAETYLTQLEINEASADIVLEEEAPELFEATVEQREPRELAVEVEIVELTTSVKETLQFPEIEEILDSNKTSESGEPEDAAVEHIDLIREAKELPKSIKIGNRQGTSIPNSVEDSGNNSDSSEENAPYAKLDEIDLLSSIGRDIGVDLEKYVQPVPDVVAMEAVDLRAPRSLPLTGIVKEGMREDTNKLLDRDLPEASSADAKKKEKMARNQARRRQQTHSSQRRPDKRRAGGFDVYNIETAMPKIDLDAIETHLRAAREEERRRRNDREEIRRRLAMGPEADDIRIERGRKPSLHTRLQSGMNLQICFMNEASSDTESPGSECDSLPVPVSSTMTKHQIPARPQVLSLPSLRLDIGANSSPIDEADFFARQARLQMEARVALSQAKDMAHMQMEVERQKLKQSPITEMVRSSLEKIGVQLGEERRRLSRMLLTELNVAQLQVLANDLHARIATLNEALVEGLLRRDDLHMEQDSMLVDVEDLTRYLGAKQESLKKKMKEPMNQFRSQQTHIRSKGGIQPTIVNRSLVGFVRK
ncbi:schwannomin-interacting protein 1 homolog isoform X2 [Belonocnema kinseyi]|uniref:schwannomin-interacting protein 1 homolog isoform X2 n=1 Tax=Belonocnema kinseyi TaxID=2817044 RepID=UPI00143DB441|nr:schwannomin-interacting protein 1 homolog isoform X2 [Belonocnema kinseyi]